MSTDVAVLVSGGLDSAILAADLSRRGCVVHPIYVRFGLAWESVEEEHLRRFLVTLERQACEPLTVLSAPITSVYGAHWSVSGDAVPDERTDDDAVYLPGRNLLLLAQPSVWCALHGVPAIALGTLKGNPFSDSSRDFFDDFAALVKKGLGHSLEVLTPFAELTKAEVLDLGRDLALQHTFSCIAPAGGRHCGHCNKCAERRLAFSLVKIDDVTEYAER